MLLFRRFSLTVLVFLGGAGIDDARAGDLPSFSDPELQACFDEQAAANRWQSTDEVKVLVCPERTIRLLYGMEALTQLEELDLSDNRLENVNPLFSLLELRRLYLSGNRAIPVYDIVALVGSNRNLTHVGLRAIPVEDLTLLPFDHHFVELDLRNSGIRSLQPLSRLGTLEVLDLGDNDINYLTGLEPLVALRRLDLSNNRIRYLFDLQSLRNLTELRLSGNRDLELTDINMVLEANPGLSQLALAGIPIADFWSLSLRNVQTGEPYPLRELDLSDTGVENLQRLVELAGYGASI